MWQKKWVTWIGLGLLLALGLYLRGVNLATNPGWYSDEGTHLEIARRLLDGDWAYLAVADSVLLFGRPPLFEWLLAGVGRGFGLSMGVLRGLTAVLSTTTILLVYLLVWDAARQRWLALLAAGVVAVYPQAVVYGRFGFSYHLLAVIVLLYLLALWRWELSQRAGWLAAAALLLGLGVLSDVWALLLWPGFVLWVGWRHWRGLVWALPLSLLPPLLWAVWALLSVPDAFLFDLQFTLARMGGGSLADQMTTLATNGRVLLAQAWWLVLGVIGWGLVRPWRLQLLGWLTFVLPLLLLGRSVALFSLSAYYLIPVLPLVAVGLAWLVETAVVGSPKWVGVGTAVFLAAVVVLQTGGLMQQIDSGLPTEIDPFLLNAADAQVAIAAANAIVDEGDLVLGSPGLLWAVTGRVADFQMVAAAAGVATPHLPTDLPADRWRFVPSLAAARVVIVDNLWHNWALVHVPGVAAMLDEVAAWPIAAQSGQITVYVNPQRPVVGKR